MAYFEKVIALDNRAWYKEEFAGFLAEHKKDYERAEEMWKLALEASNHQDRVYHNIAFFYAKYSIVWVKSLINVLRYKHDYDSAEEYFKKIELVPKNEQLISGYLSFLEHIRVDIPAANAVRKQWEDIMIIRRKS